SASTNSAGAYSVFEPTTSVPADATSSGRSAAAASSTSIVDGSNDGAADVSSDPDAPSSVPVWDASVHAVSRRALVAASATRPVREGLRRVVRTGFSPIGGWSGQGQRRHRSSPSCYVGTRPRGWGTYGEQRTRRCAAPAHECEAAAPRSPNRRG